MAKLSDSAILELLRTNPTLQNIGFKSAQKECDLIIEDIGDGNLNDVLKVSLADGKLQGDKTGVIVKHAPPYVKCIGPEMLLSPNRMAVEYKSLQKYHSISPGCVPVPYCYTEQNHAAVLEYLDGYEVMKTQLISGKVDKVAAQRLAENIGKIHTATHITNISEEDFKQLQIDFQNEDMIEITRQFIFTNPFVKGHPTNNVKPEVMQTAESVYTDQSLLTDVDKFRRMFLETKECLVHGDLHTGSVMVKDGVPKIIDNEFTYVGPAAFDLGLLVAHYIITHYQHMLTEENNPVHRQVAFKAMDACKTIGNSYLEFFQPQVADRKQYIQDFMSNVAGFAGCELIRRVLGVAHVPDINHSGSMELEVLQSGLRLLRGHTRIQTMDRLLFIGLALC